MARGEMKAPYVMMFVPAGDERKRAKALTVGADAVIFDLEDAVPDGMKEATRPALFAWLDDLYARRTPGAAEPRRPELWVRINGPATRWFDDDLAMAGHPALDGIVLPMVEKASTVRRVAEALEEGDARRDRPGRLILLIETARGQAELASLAAVAPEGTRVAFGTLDFGLDLGLSRMRPDDTELMWLARARIVMDTRAAGLPPPIDGVFPDLDDDDGLRRECRRVAELGFTGKLTVHPRQIGIVREALRPDPAELALARSVIEAYERAEAEGKGAVRLGHLMIDRPVVEQARKLLAVWE